MVCVRMNHPKITPRYLAPFAAAIFSLVVSTASAAVLAEYQFVNGTGNATTQATGVTGSAASWSFAVGQIGFGGSAQSAYVQTSSLTSAYEEGKYLTFTLTAGAGKVLNLSSFTFDLGGSASSTGGGNIILSSEVRTSAGETAYASPLVVSPPSGTNATHTIPSTDSSLAYTTYTVDLSGADFQGRDSIAFRLFVASSASPGTRYLRFDNFSIEGTVVDASPVPEPASAAWMAGAVVLGLVACKRRRFQ
jgi:hypothetical protein